MKIIPLLLICKHYPDDFFMSVTSFKSYWTLKGLYSCNAVCYPCSIMTLKLVFDCQLRFFLCSLEPQMEVMQVQMLPEDWKQTTANMWETACWVHSSVCLCIFWDYKGLDIAVNKILSWFCSVTKSSFRGQVWVFGSCVRPRGAAA